MRRMMRILVAIGLVAVGLVAGLYFAGTPETDNVASGPSGFVLGPPAFAQTASRSFLEEEAGIAAYVKVDQAIDIGQLRASFSVVEQLEESYVTGQISIPELEENWHPHLFVTNDGWIVAYHTKYEPTSTMLTSWITHEDTTLTGTTLELAVHEVLRSAGIGPSGIMEEVQYYHFQFPLADRIMLIREDESSGNQDDFYLTIPAGLGILDASWIAYDSVGGWSGIRIDGQGLAEGFHGIKVGDLLPRLRTGTRHTISVWRGDYGVVLLYQAP